MRRVGCVRASVCVCLYVWVFGARTRVVCKEEAMHVCECRCSSACVSLYYIYIYIYIHMRTHRHRFACVCICMLFANARNLKTYAKRNYGGEHRSSTPHFMFP